MSQKQLRTDDEMLEALLDVSSEEEEEEDIIESDTHDFDSDDSDDDPDYIPEDNIEAVEDSIVPEIIKIINQREEKAQEINDDNDETPGCSKQNKKRKIRDVQINTNKKSKKKNEKKTSAEANEAQGVIVPSSIISIDEETITGKDKKFVWAKQSIVTAGGKTPSRNVVHIRPGPPPTIRNSLLPMNCFKHFFSEDILEEILRWTNIEIINQRKNYSDQSHATLSILEMVEFEAFLGLLVLSAALKDNHLSTKLMFDNTYCGERYKATMTERRFKFILNCLRFDDKNTRDARRQVTKLAPISCIWEKLLNNCRDNYKPGSYITIDEQLVGFRGRCPFRMYIPSKPNKYGIKIIMSCDSGTKYMLDAMVYLGKGSVPHGVPSGEYYVLELLKTVKGTNRNLTIDNWFTSVSLVQRLLHEYKITTIGTIKKNKPQLPGEATDIKFQNRAAPTSLFIFHEDMTVVSYKPTNKKLVLLASSMHNDCAVDESTQKPEIVLAYNKTKGGVDSFDQMCQNMNHCRKTRRWPLCFFLNMINIATINAYVIYTYNLCSRGQKPQSRVDFMLSLHKELTQAFQKKRLAENKNVSRHLKQSILSVLGETKDDQSVIALENQTGPRKYCNLCHYSKRRYSTTYCKCGIPICAEHSVKRCPDCV